MRERRRSLLDFAIAASAGVLPALVGVVLAVDATHDGTPRAHEDSHVSARQHAALQTFEHGIVERGRVGAAPSVPRLVAGIPECAGAWQGGNGWSATWRRWLGRPDPAAAAGTALVAQLAALDGALRRMSEAGNRRVAVPVGFDLDHWAKAARVAVAAPVASPRYPGRGFHVQCDDLAAGARLLARHEGRGLEALAWRGTEVERTTASWRPDQHVAIAPRHLARANPWSGLPGCVFLGGTAGASGTTGRHFISQGRGAAAGACTQREAFDPQGDGAPVAPSGIAGEPGPDTPPGDARWRVPPSLPVLLQALDPLRQPGGALLRDAAFDGGEGSGGHRVRIGGAPVDIGLSVALAIDPYAQAIAQQIAACYTGRQDVCRALHVQRDEDVGRDLGRGMLEHAMVRMAAIAIIDVASGRIEAVAGALSRCAREEVDGPGRHADCDARLPYPVRYRPDALLNPAVFHDAMPASLVKPVMAAAFLSNAAVGQRWLGQERQAMRAASAPGADSVRGQLMRSDSARFLDRMFCADRNFGACERPWEIQAAAVAFGWNRMCDGTSERCGRRDVLFGRALPDDGAPGAWVPFGRLLVEPDAIPGTAFHLRAPVALDTGRIARCAAGPDGRRRTRDDWEKCRGGMIVDVVAEGWGQGHARSTALGAAGMIATLASAANGQTSVQRPHLVRDVLGVGRALPAPLRASVDEWKATRTDAHGLSREAAEVILDGMSYSHRQGTARRACEQVLGTGGCARIGWMAGKTGTPTFPNDDRSLDELAALCAPKRERTREEQAACGNLRPYKWYAAAYRSDPSGATWDKAIAVLVERNWLAVSGRIHGAGDHGPNPAAEIAFQVVVRTIGAPGGSP